MFKRILSATLALLFAAPAVASDQPVVNTLFSDGTTNVWTQADLVSALQLMNRRYHRDMQSETGRTGWHGKIVRTVVDTNALIIVRYHEDGYAHTNAWQSRTYTPADAAVAAARRRAARLAALNAKTSSLPAAVSSSVAQNYTRPTVVETNVNVTVTVGK